MRYAIYNQGTGEISHIFIGDSTLLDINTPNGFSAILFSEEQNDYYVSDGYAVLRPIILPLSLSGSQLSLANLPAGSTVTITNEDGDSITVTDADDTVSITTPGRYEVTVVPPFPYKPHSQVLTND